MQYQPHSYQEYAAEFIKNNPVSCLLLTAVNESVCAVTVGSLHLGGFPAL